MDKKELIQRLQDLAIDDRLEELISLLLENLSDLGLNELETELIHHSARLSSLEREKRLGIIPGERWNIERNQLRQILIEQIVQLKRKMENTSVGEVGATAKGPQMIEEASQLFVDEKFREAEVIIRKALQQPLEKVDKAKAYAILGNILSKLNYMQEAMDAHLKSIDLEPDNPSYWTNLGVVYRLTAEYDKANECYQKALELNPEKAETHASLGALHLSYSMDFKKAVYHLQKAIDLNPGMAVSYSNMAIAQANLGKFEEADRFLKRAIMRGYSNAENARRMIENLKHG